MTNKPKMQFGETIIENINASDDNPGTAYTNATAIEWGIAKKLARRGYFDGCVSDRLWPLRYRWPGFWRITPKGLAAL